MKLLHYLRFFLSASALKIPCAWIKYPHELKDKSVCLFITYAKLGVVSKPAIFNMKSWKDSGFKVVCIIHIDEYPSLVYCSDLDFCDGILIRKNIGYDFGAWSTGIQLLPDIINSKRLACVNDSIIGPLGDLKEFISRIDSIDADVVGAVESKEVNLHIQSFMIFYNKPALKSPVFMKFWSKVKSGNRSSVVKFYELMLLKFMVKGGLRVKSLFEAIDEKNPTLFHWHYLIESGFPFLKIQLIKDNPWDADLNGLQELIASLGYDIKLLEDLT